MAPVLIDMYAEEVYISDTLAKIKRQYRTMASLRARWFIHRILPNDSIIVDWSNRARLELEIDIAQWFTVREKLEQLLWKELTMFQDELDPLFEYQIDYVKHNYGPDAPREKYFQYIRSVWCLYTVGRLHRRNLPAPNKEHMKEHFCECFGSNDVSHEWLEKFFHENKTYTFTELETIAKKLYSSRPKD